MDVQNRAKDEGQTKVLGEKHKGGGGTIRGVARTLAPAQGHRRGRRASLDPVSGAGNGKGGRDGVCGVPILSDERRGGYRRHAKVEARRDGRKPMGEG